MKSKAYDKKTTLFQFKVEKIMDYGPNIVAAFASEKPAVTTELQHFVATMINVGRNGGDLPAAATNPHPPTPGGEFRGGMSMSPSALSPGGGEGSNGYGGIGGGGVGGGSSSSSGSRYNNKHKEGEGWDGEAACCLW